MNLIILLSLSLTIVAVRGGDSCNCCCGNNDSLIIYLLNKILDTVSNTTPLCYEITACPTNPWPTTPWPTTPWPEYPPTTTGTTPWPTWPTETTLSPTWPTESTPWPTWPSESDGSVPVVPTEPPPGYDDGEDFNPPPTHYPGPF